MAKHGGAFTLYERPGATIVWCAPGFREQVSTLYADCTAAARKDFANINALVRRLVAGEQLSNSSFPKEPPGFAFKAGRIRFYGVYSKKHLRCFVMSHAVRKLHDKLEVQDREKMQKCLDEFDALPQLPQQNHGTT